jgi:DNA polymerase III, delta subunit
MNSDKRPNAKSTARAREAAGNTAAAKSQPTSALLDWRGLIGVDEVKAELALSLDGGRMHPVLMIEGREGAGKRHLAMWAVARFLCDAVTPAQKACGICDSCREVLSGNHRDVMIFDFGRETIKTSDVETLQEFFNILSAESVRFGVIMNADRMTMEACNRLLKTLEEPTEQTRVILTTSRPLVMPATLLGRCLRWKVKPPPREIVIDWIRGKLNALGRTAQSEEMLRSWATRLGFSVGNISREIDENAPYENKVHSDVLTLLTATRPAQVLQAASDIARVHKSKVPEILGAVEWELSELYKQSLSRERSGAVQDQSEAIIRIRRRSVLRDIRHLAVIGKVVLNAQLVAESIGLCRWEKSEL